MCLSRRACLCVEQGPPRSDICGWRQAPRASEAAKRLALLAIGEIGRKADLSGYGALRKALTAALTGGSEEVKAAAAVALGGVALGNLAAYLPFILTQISEQARLAPAACLLPFLHALQLQSRGGHSRAPVATLRVDVHRRRRSGHVGRRGACCAGEESKGPVPAAQGAE